MNVNTRKHIYEIVQYFSENHVEVRIDTHSYILCEEIKQKGHVNTRLGTDHHQLIMPPISKDCSNTFLERSFIYAVPCELNILSEYIRTLTFDCFRKNIKTMLFTQ